MSVRSNLRRPALLCVLALAACNATTAAAAQPLTVATVAIATWFTQATVLRPEAHVLLSNRSDQPVEFLFEFGMSESERSIACTNAGDLLGDKSSAEERRALTMKERLRRRSIAGRLATLGVIPAKGWTHRSYLVGLAPGELPCRVPYRLSLQVGTETVHREGVLEIGTQELDDSEPAIAPDALHVEVHIEKNRISRGHGMVVRLLVRNEGRTPGVVGLTGFRIDCPAGDLIWEDRIYTTLEGEDAGPARIAPGKSHVFVVGLEADESRRPNPSCRGTVRFSEFNRAGMRALKRLEFALQASGYVAIGSHGFQPGRYWPDSPSAGFRRGK